MSLATTKTVVQIIGVVVGSVIAIATFVAGRRAEEAPSETMAAPAELQRSSSCWVAGAEWTSNTSGLSYRIDGDSQITATEVGPVPHLAATGVRQGSTIELHFVAKSGNEGFVRFRVSEDCMTMIGDVWANGNGATGGTSWVRK